MKNIRALFKLIAFLGNTLFFYSLIMLVLFFSFLGISYEWWRGYLLNVWGRNCCTILGVNLMVKGKAPEPPFFLVSNHLSYIDVFVLFSQVRGLFVAKSDVKRWPLIGFITKTCGILFIDRSRKRDISRVNQLISKNINQNQGVIMFPESKTSPGVEILPFRSSLLEPPAAINLPVSYAIISYSTPKGEEDACKTICWWDDAPFLVHFFNLLKKDRFSAAITFGEETVASTDRKKLAMLLEKQIKSDFQPVIDPLKFAKTFGEKIPEKG
ncbi:MAG: lysophospholipid acyltransferase family protein [Balneolaceae bacterium]